MVGLQEHQLKLGRSGFPKRPFLRKKIVEKDLTRFCRYEESSFRPEVSDLDVVIQNRLCVVGHNGKEVALEHHLAVIEIKAADLENAHVSDFG